MFITPNHGGYSALPSSVGVLVNNNNSTSVVTCCYCSACTTTATADFCDNRDFENLVKIPLTRKVSMGRRISCRCKKKPKVDNWESLVKLGRTGMSWDLSSVSKLQTLTNHRSDVNSVVFGRNFTLATCSRFVASSHFRLEEGNV